MKKLKYIASAILTFLIPTIALAALSTVPLIRNGAINSEYTIYSADKLGVGTTTPLGKLSVHANNGETNSLLFVIASSTQAGATSTLYSVDNSGRHTFGGPAPSCGTGCSSVSGNDNGGAITTGAGVTSVTLNFSRAWNATPVCTMSDNSTAVTGDISSVSTTAITFSFSVGITGTIYYQCAIYGN